MTKRQILHVAGLTTGTAGYLSFLSLTLAGVAAAPLALAAMPVGLAVVLRTAER